MSAFEEVTRLMRWLIALMPRIIACHETTFLHGVRYALRKARPKSSPFPSAFTPASRIICTQRLDILPSFCIVLDQPPTLADSRACRHSLKGKHLNLKKVFVCATAVLVMAATALAATGEHKFRRDKFPIPNQY